MSESPEKNAAEVLTVVKPKEDARGDVARGKVKPKRQPNYHVIIWNDEEHTFEYVIELLMRLFAHDLDSAIKITRHVDRRGKGVAGTYHLELAELKRDQILAYGPDRNATRSNGPLRATIEPCPE